MITPHSSWFMRKQKLSEFHFTNSIKEVPSLVLDSAEVTRGVKLVKGLPNSEGVYVKDYFGEYTTTIMTDMNPSELKVIVLEKLKVEEGFVYSIGLRIPFELEGALHPASILTDGSNKYFVLGKTAVTDLEGKEGESLIVQAEGVQRILQHGKIKYGFSAIKVLKVDPPAMGSGVGDLDNLVGETVEMHSKFNIGDMIFSEGMLKGEIIGKVADVLGDNPNEVAVVIWENGEQVQFSFGEIFIAEDKFSETRIMQAKRSIREEGMIIYNTSAVLEEEKEQKKGPFITSTKDGHFHNWTVGDKETKGQFDTEYNPIKVDHKHKIDIKLRKASEADGHDHDLTVQGSPKG